MTINQLYLYFICEQFLFILFNVLHKLAVSGEEPFLLFCFLQEIVSKFAKTPEPEFPGHVILEQYQAQVSHCPIYFKKSKF